MEEWGGIVCDLNRAAWKNWPCLFTHCGWTTGIQPLGQRDRAPCVCHSPVPTLLSCPGSRPAPTSVCHEEWESQTQMLSLLAGNQKPWRVAGQICFWNDALSRQSKQMAVHLEKHTEPWGRGGGRLLSHDDWQHSPWSQSLETCVCLESLISVWPRRPGGQRMWEGLAAYLAWRILNAGTQWTYFLLLQS